MTLRNPHETVESDELPIVVESGKHSETRIVSGECGNCGYDRLKVEQQTGHWSETCMLCDAYRYDGGDGWQLPTTAKQRRNGLREADEIEGPVEKRSTPHETRVHDIEVFEYTDTELYKWFDGFGGSIGSLTDDQVTGLLKALESTGRVSEYIEDEIDGKTVTNSLNAPPNSNATHAGILEHRGLPPALWISMAHEGFVDTPIHFNPRADGISV
jgi:hypothetical protein